MFVALAVWGGSNTAPAGPSGKFVRTARRYRTITIQGGPHTITAADPLPDDLRQALDAITCPSGPAH